jgi:hypothetical protein
MRHLALTCTGLAASLAGLLACTPVDTQLGSNAAGTAGSTAVAAVGGNGSGGKAQGGATQGGAGEGGATASGGADQGGTGQGGAGEGGATAQGGAVAVGGTAQGGTPQGGSSGSVCDAGKKYMEPPGCPTSDLLPLAAKGCYQTCASAGDTSCPTGEVCQPRQENPCICPNPSAACCEACARSTWVCLPKPTSCNIHPYDNYIQSAENSFGMCNGQCDFTLRLSPNPVGLGTCDVASLAVAAYYSMDPLFTIQGNLTPFGHERAQSLALSIASSGVQLQSVYGCPDCVDGGATVLTFTLGGTTSTHAFDFSDGPPAVLADVNRFVQAIITSLKACVSNEYVQIVADSCGSPTKACGARAGNTCSASEYCAYQAGQYCGAADAESTCHQRPAACDEVLAPVCGCDQVTYTNACLAATAGTGVYADGACTN